MSWIDHVNKARGEVPPWIVKVLEHPRFSALHREGTSWFLYAGDGHMVEGASLREACERFVERYGIK